ncbi:hypothetical protein [Rothia mucilaginosa]|uniref:hypothetical protein n=1 Tax=Rothia mucilaginosa TaxID=43675 RepID=UPI0026EFF9D3|nr:hypothetical protein [Rothia mucilaginosa]
MTTPLMNTTTIIDTLNRDWTTTSGQMVLFQDAPMLAADVLHLLLTTVPGPAQDAIWHEAITRALTGDTTMERTLTQSTIPWILRLSRQNAIMQILTHRGEAEDAFSILAGAALEAIRKYPTHRTEKVRGTLFYRLLRIVTRLKDAYTHPIDTEDTTTHTPLTFTDTTTNRTTATEAADRLLGDAINAGTITAKESDLLIAYYTDAAALAQREGCSVKALECRVRRLRNRVRDGLNLA